MNRFRHKPTEVRAVQFDPTKPLPVGVTQFDPHWSRKESTQVTYSYTDVRSGYAARILPGDWIVYNEFEESYVIRKALFEHQFEPV